MSDHDDIATCDICDEDLADHRARSFGKTLDVCEECAEAGEHDGIAFRVRLGSAAEVAALKVIARGCGLEWSSKLRDALLAARAAGDLSEAAARWGVVDSEGGS